MYNAQNDYRNYLTHYGIQGQKWGIRNGPPYPIQKVNKKRIIEKSKNPQILKDRPHSDYNLEKWGSSRDNNILWVTGIAGSGKSTVANKFADENKADSINIDLYTFKTADKYTKYMSKGFNKYLDKNVPNWKKMQKEAYEVLTKTDRRNKKAAGKWFDTFQEALEGYGREQYGKRKVVAEGVQILDETLFYNNKQALRGRPLVIMKTSVDDAIISRMLRDTKPIEKLLEPERVNQLIGWLDDIDTLEKVIK